MGKEEVLGARRERKEKLAKAQQYYKEGNALFKAANTKQEHLAAAEQLTVAISLHAENPRFFSARGNCFKIAGELQRAFFDFSSAIRLDNSNASFFCSRGLTLRRLKRTRDAVSDLTRAGFPAIGLVPNSICNCRCAPTPIPPKHHIMRIVCGALPCHAFCVTCHTQLGAEVRTSAPSCECSLGQTTRIGKIGKIRD